MRASLVIGVTATFVFYGCAAGPDSPGTANPAGSTPLAREQAAIEPVSTIVDARPAVLVNGQALTWGELRPALSEAAGGTALREALLDRRLADLAAQNRLTVTGADEAAERRRLVETLAPDPDTAVRLLEELRRRQGLGPSRFAALLRRNAVLRHLVQDRVTVDDAAVDQMFDIRYGPKRQVRIITTADLATASEIANLARSGGATFTDLAIARSTDISAARGGLLEPIARHDPTYPAALRQAIWSLDGAGAVSNPILLEAGYAVIQLEREQPASGVTASAVRDEIESLVRLRRERILMDQLAARILRDANVTIFDASLEYSWRTGTGR